MGDLEFNIISGEVVLENGDFKMTDNPSVQNGSILLYSQVAFILNPVLGVGFCANIIGKPVADVTYDLSRWKQQAISDGAKNCNYNISWTMNDYSDITYNINVSYL